METTPNLPHYRSERHVSIEAVAARANSPTALEEMNEVRPLGQEGRSLIQVEKHLRMRHVLDRMDPDDVEVLVAFLVNRQTQQEVAREYGVSQQAVSKRLRTARANFLVAFGEHWNDPLDLTLLGAPPTP